jgi:[acyl-carrier-protein] S-malonyltransferase
MKTSLVFPGQGSQYVGMGLDLYNNSPIAKKYYEKADEILGYSLSKICFEGPLDTLKETRYTQPALFVHSVILFEMMKDKLGYSPTAFSATAGHSVGEFAALYAAEVFSFEEGLRLVSLRGELMFNSGLERPGTMFAVIGLDDAIVEQTCKEITEANAPELVVPANYNSPGQLVVSGSRDVLRANSDKFKAAGARMVKELVVSGAFHSPLLDSSSEKLTTAINAVNFADPVVPVYQNVTANPEKSGETIKQNLIKQLTAPVLWSQTMANFSKDSFDNFIEIGAGNVLQGLIKRTIEGVAISGVDKFEDLEKY